MDFYCLQCSPTASYMQVLQYCYHEDIIIKTTADTVRNGTDHASVGPKSPLKGSLEWAGEAICG